jgi:hypothetical protein
MKGLEAGGPGPAEEDCETMENGCGVVNGELEALACVAVAASEKFPVGKDAGVVTTVLLPDNEKLEAFAPPKANVPENDPKLMLTASVPTTVPAGAPAVMMELDRDMPVIDRTWPMGDCASAHVVPVHDHQPGVPKLLPLLAC